MLNHFSHGGVLAKKGLSSVRLRASQGFFATLKNDRNSERHIGRRARLLLWLTPLRNIASSVQENTCRGQIRPIVRVSSQASEVKIEQFRINKLAPLHPQ